MKEQKNQISPFCSSLDFSDAVIDSSVKLAFEISGHSFVGLASEEQSRPRRIVRVGLIQNKIVLPTSCPVQDQRDALFKRIGDMIEAAGNCGANIVCLQEAWSK